MASHSGFDFYLVNKLSFHNSTGVLDFSPSLREEHWGTLLFVINMWIQYLFLMANNLFRNFLIKNFYSLNLPKFNLVLNEID